MASLASLCLVINAHAQSSLTLLPTTCVTLQQGRQCHANIHVRWQLAQPEAVCIYLDEQPLECWSNAPAGEWQWVFTDTQSRTLHLRRVLVDGSPANILASARIEVSWVQNSHKKHIWRRF